MIQRLQYLHSIDYIHRDIKPNNFVIGTNGNQDKIYLLDFGLSKKFMDGKKHIAFKQKRVLIGTTRYASINAHYYHEQSRRDDLESLGYVLLFLLLGRLP